MAAAISSPRLPRPIFPPADRGTRHRGFGFAGAVNRGPKGGIGNIANQWLVLGHVLAACLIMLIKTHAEDSTVAAATAKPADDVAVPSP